MFLLLAVFLPDLSQRHIFFITLIPCSLTLTYLQSLVTHYLFLQTLPL